MFATLLVGIMCAMQQEAESILCRIGDKEVVQVGARQFIKGTFDEVPVVLSIAGVGKVSAAVTATLLKTQFGVDEIIFTGVAGGGKNTSIGDIVVGSSYLQYDLDPRPHFPQFHILSLNTQLIHANADLVLKMTAAANRYFEEGISFPWLNITEPKVHTGTIVSGDQFIGDSISHEKIAHSTKKLLPNGFLAIEMEGAAVAQVCEELGVPFIVVRAISDKADHLAAVNFQTFIDQVARGYSIGVLVEYLKNRAE